MEAIRNYNCCQKMRLLELMFLMHCLQGAHHNFISDKNANQKGLLEVFLNRDRDGSVKWEQNNWRKLSAKCDQANRAVFKEGATGPKCQMPLQWTPSCEYQLIPYGVSSKSARPVK